MFDQVWISEIILNTTTDLPSSLKLNTSGFRVCRSRLIAIPGVGLMFICFWNTVWDCHVPCVYSKSSVVLDHSHDMDVAGEEHFRDRIDQEVVLAVGGNRRLFSICRREMPPFQHPFHHGCRVLIGRTRREADLVVNRSAVIHEHPDSLEAHEGRVLNECTVFREILRELPGDCRLRLGPAYNIVIARAENYFQP